MPTYKLKYFNIRGRAELPRLMFAEAGQCYEDIRFSMEDWKTEKEKTPFGQLPVLMIDDKPLPQTGAIVRYLARELKLEPEDSLQKAYCDMIMETIVGTLEKFPYAEHDPEKKAKLAKEAFEKHICPTFAKMEAKFAEAKKDFLVGQELTVADLAMMNALATLDQISTGFMDKYPALKQLGARVQARPNIKKWLETRPKTEF